MSNDNTDLLLAGIAGACLGHLLARKPPRKNLFDKLEPLLPILAGLAATRMSNTSDEPSSTPFDDLDLGGSPPFADIIKDAIQRHGPAFAEFDLAGVLAKMRQSTEGPADASGGEDPLVSDEPLNEDSP